MFLFISPCNLQVILVTLIRLKPFQAIDVWRLETKLEVLFEEVGGKGNSNGWDDEIPDKK